MRIAALLSLSCLPLAGCLSGATATGSGDLIITEYADINNTSGGPTTYVEIGNPTAMAVDLAGYSVGAADTLGFGDFPPSIPLTGSLGPSESIVVEVAGGEFANLFGQSPTVQFPAASDFGFRPDEVYLFLADGSGFNGASESRNDATLQDIVNETGGLSMNAVHICRRQGVPRGRGRYDPSEWIETDTFGMREEEIRGIVSLFSLDCP